MLMAQLAENAQFGTEGDPRVCNLRRGTPTAATPAPRASIGSGARRRIDVDEEDEEEGEETTPEAAPRVERRQGEDHQLAACTAGVCSNPGCSNQMANVGCKTCGVRLCGGCSKHGFDCINAHLRGVKAAFTPRKAITWLDSEGGDK